MAAASRGVETDVEVVKCLLVDADVVMTASALLRRGPQHIATTRDIYRTGIGRPSCVCRCLRGRPMKFETLFSIAALGTFIWAVRFLLPKAMKEDSALALTSTVLTALFALLLWLLVGVGTRSWR